ncbi:MAG: peptidylprolyl isomerase [Bacteroidales bacterium]|nr:peptidylprolyl isomerase [Bacteroidales bacterium]
MIKRKNSQSIVISLPVLALIIIMTIFSTNISAQDQEAPKGVIIDEVIATVGGNIVQYSELEAQYLQYTMQEGVPADPQKMKCDMLENMIYQKLLLNQAELDSVEVTDGQVESELDRRLRYYISLLGSKEKFEEFYQKSVVEFKEELREQVREMMLVENVQQSITTDVKITPTEIRQFYKDIPEDSIPFINSEVRLAQIVKLPPVNDEEIERVKNKLQEIRYRVLNGENFATLAILYSEDPGSSKQGGELGLFGRGEMYPEFEAAAFSLKEKNEVSDIIKTDAGFHILQLIERRGEYVNVRHILLRPKVSPLDLAKAKVELDSIANLIEEGKFTFDEAVQEFSEDPSKNNGGLVLNPMTNTSLFESDQLDPKVFFVIDKLEVGEISAPVQFQTQEGKDAYRILYVKDRTEPHKANLKQDYDKIQEWALEKKKQDELLKWVNEKVKNTYVKVNENYQDCTFSKNWTL